MHITCITWAASSGVPCFKSCPLIASTRSLLHSLPSWAANPPSKRSRIKTPGSSVLRTSLMPSCSLESRLCSVTWKLSSREELVVSAWLCVRLPNRLSLSTVRCSTEQGWESTARAWLWETLLMSKLLTCRMTTTTKSELYFHVFNSSCLWK